MSCMLRNYTCNINNDNIISSNLVKKSAQYTRLMV